MQKPLGRLYSTTKEVICVYVSLILREKNLETESTL